MREIILEKRDPLSVNTASYETDLIIITLRLSFQHLLPFTKAGSTGRATHQKTPSSI